MVIGAVVIGQLVADMFKQVFIELMRKLSWRVHVVNYYFENILKFFYFTQIQIFGLVDMRFCSSVNRESNATHDCDHHALRY